jgi:hypothetical protein
MMNVTINVAIEKKGHNKTTPTNSTSMMKGV